MYITMYILHDLGPTYNVSLQRYAILEISRSYRFLMYKGHSGFYNLRVNDVYIIFLVDNVQKKSVILSSARGATNLVRK